MHRTLPESETRKHLSKEVREQRQEGDSLLHIACISGIWHHIDALSINKN